MGKLDPKDIDNILHKTGHVSQAEYDDLQVSLEEIDSFGDKESLKEMYTDMAKYNRMIRERITFCNESLTEAIPFTRENLYLICAYSGSGKSTIAANVSFPLYKQGKKTLVISNEESKHDILFRVGCLELGYSFNEYKKGRMPKEDQLRVASLFPDIAKYVKVIDVNFNNGITTKVEGVKNILEQVKDVDYSCAMIDYFQLIKFSVKNPNAKSYDVLNDFRIWLGQYIKRSNIPIVAFAQLHSIGKRNNRDLDSRIKHCPDIYEPATVCIEVIPNFEEKTSDFVIHKDRFGLAGHRISCGFENGRYVNMTADYAEQVEERKRQQQIKKAEDELDKMQRTADDGNE